MSDKELNAKFGSELERLLKKINLSKVAFAREVKVSANTVINWTRGRCLPNSEKRLKIVEFFSGQGISGFKPLKFLFIGKAVPKISSIDDLEKRLSEQYLNRVKELEEKERKLDKRIKRLSVWEQSSEKYDFDDLVQKVQAEYDEKSNALSQKERALTKKSKQLSEREKELKRRIKENKQTKKEIEIYVRNSEEARMAKSLSPHAVAYRIMENSPELKAIINRYNGQPDENELIHDKWYKELKKEIAVMVIEGINRIIDKKYMPPKKYIE